MVNIAQLEQALINADSAGDTEAATVLAQEIQKIAFNQQNQPKPFDEEARTEELYQFGLQQGALQPKTFANYAGEVPKGLLGGAANLYEQAALGVATALPESYEAPVREGILATGDFIERNVTEADLNMQDSVPRKFSDALGSFAGIIPAYLLGGSFGASALTGFAGAGEASERAREAGATQEERNLAALGGAAIGLTEAIPIARIFSKLPPGAKSTILDRGKRVLEATGVEGLQEFAANLGQNFIEKGIYNPEQELLEGAGEAAGYGGGVGGFVASFMELFIPGKRRRSTTQTDPTDATDEILAISGPDTPLGLPAPPQQITGPGTPAVVRVDSKGKAQTSEELSTERTKAMETAERARQEILRTGAVSSKTMQDLRNANIPLESVSKVLEETKELGAEAKFNLEPIVVKEEADLKSPEKPPLQLEKPIVYVDAEGEAKTERNITDEVNDKKATTGASFDTPSPEILAQYETALENAVQIKDAKQRQAAITKLKKEIDNVDVFEAIYSKNKSDIPPFILKEIEGAKNADPGRADATRSRDGVQDDISKGDVEDAKKLAAPKAKGVDSAKSSTRPAVNTKVTGDNTLEVTPKEGEAAVDFLARKREAEKTKTSVEEELIFKDETLTSLEGIQTGAALTPSQKANINVVREKFTPQIDKIRKDKTIPTKERRKQIQALNGEMILAINDIKQGIPEAEAEAARREKGKEVQAAEIKRDEAQLDELATGEKAGLDASARKNVEKQTSLEIINTTKEAFEKKGKAGKDRLQRAEKEFSTPATDPYDRGTKGGTLDSSDLQKIQDLVTGATLPKSNPLFKVQERLRKAPYPADVLLDDAPHEISAKVKRTQKASTKDPKTGKETVTDIDKALNEKMQNSVEASALSIEKWVNENLSEKAKEKFADQKREEVRTLKAQAEYIKRRKTSEDQVIINADNINIENERAKFEAGEITETQLNKNIDRIREKSALKKLPVDSVSNLDTPMHPVVIEMLVAGNLEAALKGLAITSQSTRVSALAKALADNIGTTKLEVVETLDSAGVFDPKTNTISLNAAEGLNTHTLLHEMLHAVVSANLENKSNPTTAQLNTLFKSVKDLIPTAYGAKNLDEFVSEAMSNPEFQTTLASINVQGEPVNVYRRFMNIIANFARKLVGVSPVSLTYIPNINESLKGLDVFSMIDTLVQGNSMFDALIAPAPEYRNADMLKLNATAEGVNSVAKAFDTIQKKINSTPSAQNFADQFIGILVDLKENARRIILKLLGTQALADVAEKAGFGNLPRTLHEAIEGQRGAMMGSDARLDIIMTKLAKFSKDSPKLKEVMDKLIYSSEYGSTINQVDPLLSKADAEAQYLRYKLEYLNNKGDLKTKSFKTKKDRDAEYSKFADPKYEAEKLNPESEKMDIWELQQKELNKLPTADKAKLLAQYTELRDTYRNMYEKLKDVVFGRIDAALAGDPEASKKLKSSVYKKIFKANTLAVYFPLTREGRYKLTYSYKNVNQAPESEASPSYVVRMFSTRNERDRAASEIKKDDKFEKVKTDDGDFDLKHFENAPSFSFVGQTLDALKANGVDPEVQTEIVQLFINTLPETSFAKSFQKRKGFEGFIEDSLAAFRIKSYDLGRQTERLVHGKIIQDIEKQIYDLGTPDPAAMKAKSFVGKGSEALTASFISVRDELLLRGSFARNPPSEPLIKLTNQFAFIYTIGFNVSSAIVNLSQVPLFVMPYLGARYGYKETMSDITTAGKLVTAAKNNVLSFYDINEQGDYTVKSDVPKNLKAEFELIKPVVQMAAERGLLTTSFLKDALGLDESGRTSSKFDTVSSVSAFFFNHAERFNRQTTIFAGYKLELARLMGKNKNATTEQKTAAAKEAIRQAQETNGGAVLETAPRLTQRSLGRVAFMYKSYGLQMYYTMFKSFKAATDTDMSAKERSIARKQLAGVFGTSLFFAGVHGIPIYGAVSVLYNLLIAGEDDDDFDTVVRKTIGEGWYKGVPAMTGIDPSNRIRLTGLLLQENKFDRNSDLEGLIGFHLGGPALSSAKRIQRGAKDLYQGELMRGVESLLPAGVANMYKAFPLIGRISVEGGYKSRRGDIIYDDVNVLESAGQFLGFAPTGYMLEQERNNIVKGIDTAISRKRSKLLKQYYVAKRFGDFYGMREIRKDMREFSRKHREAAITSETIDRSMKQHAKTSLEMYNGIRLNPLMRETLEDSRNDWDQGLQLFD